MTHLSANDIKLGMEVYVCDIGASITFTRIEVNGMERVGNGLVIKDLDGKPYPLNKLVAIDKDVLFEILK